LANLIAEIQNEIDVQYEQYNDIKFAATIEYIFNNSDDFLVMHKVIERILREEE
jgi:hypothetical protein